MFHCQALYDTLLLISLGIGYLVLYFARREEKGPQIIGYVIGYTIIVLTLVYMLSNIWAKKNLCNQKAPFFQGVMQ